MYDVYIKYFAEDGGEKLILASGEEEDFANLGFITSQIVQTHEGDYDIVIKVRSE